jgi:hypothetical protein
LIAAFVLASAATAVAFTTGSDIALTMIAYACGCAAVGLLEPGAESIDANVFGPPRHRARTARARSSDDQEVPFVPIAPRDTIVRSIHLAVDSIEDC